MKKELIKVGTEITGFSESEKETLVKTQIIPPGLPNDVITLFARVCLEKNLSPFSKQIYITGYKNSRTGEYSYAIITGIDGFRSIAARTGVHAGTEDAKFNIKSSGAYLTPADFKPGSGPDTATVTVYKIVAGVRVPFTHTAVFNEFASTKPGSKWESMPFQMLAKVAEAFALRKAFPEQFSGIHEESEIEAFKGETINDIGNNNYTDFEVEVDEKEKPDWLEDLENAFSTCKTLEDLARLYSSNPGYSKDPEITNLFKIEKQKYYRTLKDTLEGCESKDELLNYWSSLPELHENKTAITYFENALKALENEK